MFRINCKFSDEVLIPMEAVEGTECITLDSVNATVAYIGAWDNKDGYYDDELDALCNDKWKAPFKAVRSIWISRLGSISNMWYLIALKNA